MRRKEDGSALVWTASVIVLLLAVSAFAVDLGWFYLQASKLQSAADAAALAGVVNLPPQPAQADVDAASASSANGFPIGSGTSMNTDIVDENEFKVDLTTSVNTFFLNVIGIHSINVTRSATAEYIKPVPLGSPSNCFGSDPTGAVCSGADPLFWASINGRQAEKANGDPYASAVDGGRSNPEYQREGWYDGYYYAIEMPPGTSGVQVRIYDAGTYARRIGTGPGYDCTYSETDGNPMHCQAGDYVWNGAATTTFTVYNVDSTPHDPTDNSPIGGCSLSIGSSYPDTYKNRWVTICNIPNPTTGMYVLRVQSGSGNSLNGFSIGATATSAAKPRVYGLNDMSIWSNQMVGTSDLTLAEVSAEHAGKKLELAFFDAGEADQNSWYTVRNPSGSTVNCSYVILDSRRNQIGSGSGVCRWQTTVGSTPQYNNKWILALIDIPDTYACAADCWWKMHLEMGKAHERSTWTARIVGAPVRLVD